MRDRQSEQLEQLAHMVHYPYWHQIEESQTCTERHVLQSICHAFFQRRHPTLVQTSDEEEEEQDEGE